MLMTDRLVFFIYKFYEFWFKLIPNFLLKYILIIMAYFIYTINKKHRKVIDINLDLAFHKQLSKDEKNNIAWQSYKSLMFNMSEFMENQYLSKEDLLAKGHIKNAHIIEKAIKEERKIIFITAHYGGWELALPYIALKYGTVAVVNRKMNNPYMHAMYEKARDKNNVVMLEKKVAAKGMLVAFKKGQHVAVVIDQHIGTGVEVNFCDQKVMATDSTSRLALKFDAIIIPIIAQMNDFRNYDIKVGNALDVREIEFKTEDKIAELTQLQSDIIQAQVQNKPEQWFWQHKRFKHKHNDLYKGL
jgi:KDO2-lipid IV(A) lauroyltransferase